MSTRIDRYIDALNRSMQDVPLDHKVRPGYILFAGINDITDKYIFRAVVMEAVRAAADHVSSDDIEYELSMVYNTMVAD